MCKMLGHFEMADERKTGLENKGSGHSLCLAFEGDAGHTVLLTYLLPDLCPLQDQMSKTLMSHRRDSGFLKDMICLPFCHFYHRKAF